MANTYKNIVITPNRDTDAANVPVIRFSGGDATTNTDINVRVYTSQSGTLSFEGSAGQLFSITNDLTNSIFSVNDVSGIPSIDVYANGDILLAPFGGQIFVGNTANLNFDSTRSTKIVEPAANTLTIHTAQTERIRFDSSGNVLIGRTTSTVGSGVKLDIAGAANASNLLVNGNMVFTAANDGAGSNLDADLLDGQQGSYYLANTAGISFVGNLNFPSGSVGIGTSSPNWKLHIADSTAPVIQLEEISVGNTFIGQDGNVFFIRRNTIGTTGAINIDAAGEVGIGRTDPGYALDVVGVANASNVLVNQRMVLTTQNYNSYAPTLTGTGASGSWGINVTGSAGSATTATTATNWGAYGAVPAVGTSFGTASTIGRSDVNGYTYFGYINSSTGNSENPTVSQVIVTNGTDNFYRKASIAHLTSAVQTNASGSWGINITGSAASATGSAATFTSTTQNSQFNSLGVGTAGSGTAGEIRATNNITAYYSDKRLKKNIKQISFALDKVNKISGVTFQSNEEAAKYGYTDNKTQVGVIAQEIEAVLPEIVVPAPFDIDKDDDGNEYSKSGQDYKTVQYEKLVPLLIEAIKELSGQVADLQNQIQELKK